MRYGYDLHNPLEREMFFKRHENNLKRMLDKENSIGQNFRDIIKETQEEFEYFRQREKQEQEEEKQITEKIEKELPNIIERELDKQIQKIFK